MPVGTAYDIAGYQKIEVDITSLTDFAEALRLEVEVNLKPAWERISAVLDEPRFGNSAELNLGEKRGVYDAYLQEAKLFFQNVITGTVQLADSAERIGAAYRDADEFSSIKLADVNAVLPTVVTGAAPATASELGGN
jgi:hypothetical protein